jgi:hypothetical protein
MTLRKPKSSQSPRNARHKSEYIQTLNKVLDVAKLALAAFLLLYAYFEARNKKPVEVAPVVIEQVPPQVTPPVVPEKPAQAVRKKGKRPPRKTNKNQGSFADKPFLQR